MVSASTLATSLGTPVRQPRPRCRRHMPFFSASSKFGRCVTADLRRATTPSPRTGSSCQTALKLGRSLAFVFRRDALYCARYRSGPIVCSGADDQLGQHEMSHWPQAPAIDEQLARNIAAAEVARAANLKGSSVEDEVLPLDASFLCRSAAIDPTVSFHSSDAPSTDTFRPAAFAAGPAHGRPLACRRVS